MRRAFVITLLVFALLTPNVWAAQVEYTLVDLGPLGDAEGAGISGVMTDHGKPVAYGAYGPGPQAVVLQSGKPPQFLGSLLHNGDNSAAYGGRKGVVVGAYFGDPERDAAHAFVSTKDGFMLLRLPAGGTKAIALATNGQSIAGTCQVTSNAPVPCVWPSSTAVPILLQTLGGRSGDVSAVNKHGALVGAVGVADGHAHGVYWANAQASPIDLTPHIPDNSYGFGTVTDLNDAGVALVMEQDGNTFLGVHGCRWTLRGGCEDVGRPLWSHGFFLEKISNAGVSVGYANVANPTYAPWPAGIHAIKVVGTTFTDLNDAIDVRAAHDWELSFATGITDTGVIVGYGAYQGTLHGWMLVPTHASEAAREE
jgi:hypothetical protein